MIMSATIKVPLHPTLWRTCRVLASEPRLRILLDLLREPDQTVADVAKNHGLSESYASQCLRALNARGLLAVRRVGRYVIYWGAPDPTVPHSGRLLRALREVANREEAPVASIYRDATAFTHPRRIVIMRALVAEQGLPLSLLRELTGISTPALKRHLRKLRSRGFFRATPRGYAPSTPEGEFGRALLRLVGGR